MPLVPFSLLLPDSSEHFFSNNLDICSLLKEKVHNCRNNNTLYILVVKYVDKCLEGRIFLMEW
jgi:hypothetical protein